MRLILCSLLLTLSTVLSAQEIYIDEGACPGEGCTYGERWVATDDVTLWDSPRDFGNTMGYVEKGLEVLTLTGEVQTLPGRFIVHETHGEFEPGDELEVYTYLGEGWFRVKHDGKIKEVDLRFGPWGSSNGKRCETGEGCWGVLQSELKFQWWVKVRTELGDEGWISRPEQFRGRE